MGHPTGARSAHGNERNAAPKQSSPKKSGAGNMAQEGDTLLWAGVDYGTIPTRKRAREPAKNRRVASGHAHPLLTDWKSLADLSHRHWRNDDQGVYRFGQLAPFYARAMRAEDRECDQERRSHLQRPRNLKGFLKAAPSPKENHAPLAHRASISTPRTRMSTASRKCATRNW